MKEFTCLILGLALLGGYVANIVKLFYETAGGWIAGRILGVLVPFIGCIAGYF